MAEERFSHAEGFPEEEAFTESEGGTDKAAEEKQAKVSKTIFERSWFVAATRRKDETLGVLLPTGVYILFSMARSSFTWR